MPGGFIRRYSSDPTLAELTAIEGVVIIDRDPPATLAGIPAGTVCLVGEFEDGGYEPQAVVNGQDFLATYGSFGFTYDGVPGCNPCARARYADGALTPEYWNGNGFIAATGKKFGGLVVVRVDTSVGEVQFTRLASLTGSSDFTFALSASGQHLDFDIGAGTVVATFTGAVATVTSGVGVYPTTFVGGEQLVLTVEGDTYTVTFLAADQTQAQVITRVNQTLGYTAFVSATATTIRFDGRIKGSSGSIEIVSQSALVATALNFTVAATAGTGNVPNLAAITAAHAEAVVNAASAGVHIDRDANGAIRLVNQGGGGTGTLTVVATTTALAFGFTLGASATAASGIDGVIPAGTRVRNSGGRELVTAQAITVLATSADYSIKVRHAVDDGTGLSFAVSTATVVPNPIALGAFATTNAVAVSAALTESAIDALYVLAIDKSKKVATDAKVTTIIVSARQSNTVRNRLKQNVVDAPREGCFGRVACIRPPLSTTTRVQARSTSAQPGVGAYRQQGVIYDYPGVQTFVPTIALRGTGGGAGFTVDGIIDTGSDAWMASLLSQLNPEENPGQVTDLVTGMLGVERGNPDVQTLGIDDYIAFRAAGIAAPRFDGGDAIFQSGVTSVDPLVTPQLRNINRRRMSFYIQDSLAGPLNRYAKKLATTTRKGLIISEVRGFMDGLLNPSNPDAARIKRYDLNTKDVNTPSEEALGIFRLKLLVTTLPSLDVIVLDVTAGESVVISEAA
jgi:hypothetical protein